MELGRIFVNFFFLSDLRTEVSGQEKAGDVNWPLVCTLRLWLVVVNMYLIKQPPYDSHVCN